MVNPINLAMMLILQSCSLGHSLGTGSLGDTYGLSLHSWRTTEASIRGEFYHRRIMKHEAPAFAIVFPSNGSFLTVEEHGLVDADGTVEVVSSTTSREPFVISRASRENWRCEVMGSAGPLALLSKTSDFTLMLTATLPKRSPLLETLGGWTRLHLRFPDSIPALSPCDSRPDSSGQNIPGLSPRTESIWVRPALPRWGTVPTTTARAIIHPQRVNWVYWDPILGFGPDLAFECYGAGPMKPTPAPAK